MCRMQCEINSWGRLRRQLPRKPETTRPSARCGHRQRTPKRRLTGVTGFHCVHEMGRAPQPIAEFNSFVCGKPGGLQKSHGLESVRGFATPDFVGRYGQDFSQDRLGVVCGAQGNGGGVNRVKQSDQSTHSLSAGVKFKRRANIWKLRSKGEGPGGTEGGNAARRDANSLGEIGS